MDRWHCPASFTRLVVCDFEYAEGGTGNPLLPTCMASYEIISGQEWRLWREELQWLGAAPFEVGPSTLFIAFKAESELQCFLSLGWKLPCHVLDLYSEWRWRSNGTPNPLTANSLINVVALYGIDTMTAAMKDKFRQKFIDDLPFSPEEREEALDYCQADVMATAGLYDAMVREAPFRLPASVMRGRYTKAAARVQHAGVPLDLDLVGRFKRHRLTMRAQIISEGDRDFGVYDEALSFSHEHFAAMLYRRGVRHWPHTEKSGALCTDRETLKRMADVHPWLEPWRQTKNLADTLESWGLQCGGDGRNRYSVMPFATLTGRNAPSSNRYIFGLPSGLRPLIRPAEGMGIAYCDWGCQEIGIAAALSRCTALRAAFDTGDPYIAFAILAGNAPAGATKETHPRVRKVHKAALLGVCYGMGAFTLSARIGVSIEVARRLLTLVEQLYPVFWSWCRRVISHANFRGEMATPFDKWRFQVHARTKVTTIRNFMMQATGASIMRLAAIAATEERLSIGGIVHDAFLLVSTCETIEGDAAHLLEIMSEAAEKVCGIPIPASHLINRHPDRYWDPDDEPGCTLWHRLNALLETVEGAKTAAPEMV
jgi:DNA polymerase I-like protein with 3'-5' exonuclease and polymerase domains